MEKAADATQDPAGQATAGAPSFRRWAGEAAVIVALTLLAFVGGAVVFRALQGDEVAPGEQLNRMMQEENRGRTPDGPQQA